MSVPFPLTLTLATIAGQTTNGAMTTAIALLKGAATLDVTGNPEAQSPRQSEPPLLSPGTIVKSPGGSFRYQVIGPICRLYDREELPYPCCRLQWRGKEPSWNRVGKRYVIDMATRHKVSYQVYLLSETGQVRQEELTGLATEVRLTLYWQADLTSAQKRWWWRFREP